MSGKQVSFLQSFRSLNRLTKLHSCFFWNFPYSMDGPKAGKEHRSPSFCELMSSGSFFSHFVVLLVLICSLGVSIAFARAYNDNSVILGNVFVSILVQKKKMFLDSAIRQFFLVATAAISHSCLLGFGEYLCEIRLRVYLTNVITNYFYLTGEEDEMDEEAGSDEKGAVRHDRLAHHAHFLLQLDNSIDDPEVRIGVDVPKMCKQLKIIFYGTPMYPGYFGQTICAIYFSYTFFHDFGWFFPVAIYVMFAISVLITILLAIYVSRVARHLESGNSYLQTTHHFIAKHSEHIAFLHGELNERKRLEAGTHHLGRQLNAFSLGSFPLNFNTILCVSGVNFLNLIIPGLALFWNHDQRLRDFGFLTSVRFLGWSLINVLAYHVLLAQEWSILVAVMARVTEFLEVLYSLRMMMAFEERPDGDNDQVMIADDNTRLLSTPCTWRQAPLYAPLVVKDVTLLQPSYMFAQQRRRYLGQDEGISGNHAGNSDGEENLKLEGSSEFSQRSNIMIKNVSFTVGTDDCHSVMIMGPSGVGKSTLLRVIAKLWPAVGGGYVEHPPTTIRGAIATMGSNPLLSRPTYGPGFMLFMPQRPYLTPGGSLAAQITYPLPPPNPGEGNDGKIEEICNLLRLLRLQALLELYDIFASSPITNKYSTAVTSIPQARAGNKINQTPADWSLILSDGELQRIGMARVLYHKPHIVVMDEATSAMDEDSEQIALTAIRQTRIPCSNDGNTTSSGQEYRSIHLLSVSHRSTVKPYHDWVLQISQDGTSTLEKNAEAKEF